MKNVVIAIYVIMSISFASLMDAVEKPCGNRYAFINYLGTGLGWPLLLPILGISSAFDKNGLKCKDSR